MKKLKKSTFLTDFKNFITKGNIVDLAVAVVIGGAFSAIVNSLVNDIIMPLLTLATGNGVQGLAIQLNPSVPQLLEDGTANPAAIYWNYGNFLQAIINFLIIALCIFTVLRIMMNLKKVSDKVIDKQKAAIQKKLKSGEISEEEAAAQVAAAEEAAAKETVAEEPKESTEDILRQIRDELKRLNADKADESEDAE